MDELPEKVFDEVIRRVNANLKLFMSDLWDKWSHLNVEESTRITNFKNLERLLEDYYKQISEETKCKFDKLQDQINSLLTETNELRRSLNVEIWYIAYEEDTPLWKYKEMLESHIVDFRKQMAQRKATINMLRDWQQDLCNSMCFKMQEVPTDPMPSEHEINRYRELLEDLQSEKDNRIKLFLECQTQIKEIMIQLGKKPSHKFEQLVCHSMSIDFPLDEENMSKLAKLYREYCDIYEETKERFVKLREKLNQLWECLDVELQYRNEFLSNHTGCTVDTEEAITNEIARLQVKVIVQKIRNEIVRMWEVCMFGEVEKESFVYMFWDNYNEDVLDLHEIYLSKLKDLYAENTRIFDLLKNRSEMWVKIKELEEAANKPGRYNNRGGQLLQEEKQRKKIAAKLPKIESDLLELAQQYEKRNGKAFTVKGKLLAHLIQSDWDEWRQHQALKMSARKANATPVPMHSRLGLTPQTAPKAGGSMALSRCNSLRPPMHAVPSTWSTPLLQATRTSRRRLDLNSNQGKENKAVNSVPKIAVNGNTLKTKRRRSKRLNSSKRRSNDKVKKENDSTLMTTYTHFKEHLHENTSWRSSVVPDLLVKPNKQVPKIAVNGNTLKTKRRRSKRLNSSKRRSNDKVKKENDSTLMTTYTHFKEHLHENTSWRSSVVPDLLVKPNKQVLQPRPPYPEDNYDRKPNWSSRQPQPKIQIEEKVEECEQQPKG